MGITFVEGIVAGPAGEAEVRFLVDSGATYTVLPEQVWRKIGVTPKRRLRFQLADGQLLERDVGNCEVRLALDGLPAETPTPVVLGEPGDQALLGSVTLEELGLVLNPFTRTLHPMNLLLI
jgi:predicted aspartyl protease